MSKGILILGAGPAGMACAMELSKAGKNTTIIEKEQRVGGLASTLNFKENDEVFRTDIGPHRFFSKNPYLYEFIEGLLKEKWIQVPRQTRQYIDGKWYDYPIKPLQAFRNIGVFNASLMAISYVLGNIRYKMIKKPIRNFEDYIIANFGKRLGSFNMLNYTEKIWGVPCSTLHADWAEQRIKGLNLTNALIHAFKKRDDGVPKTLVESFYYPQYGTGLIYETIAKKIQENGSRIKFNSSPIEIQHKNNKITKVIVQNGKKKELVSPEWLVTSIPITEFVKMLKPQPPADVLKAVSELKWRSQVYLFITLDKPRITKDNWIYFPDQKIPFGRVAEMKNFSKDMSPSDKTSLFVEFFVNESDKIWNMTKEELFEISIKHFEKMGFFKRNEVRNIYLIKRKNNYPIYDLGYKKNLKIIQEYLNNFTNLKYIGRPGRFRYNNQDHSLEMGILAAKGIIDGKDYNIDQIGNEKEYFESGNIKDGKTSKNN